MSSSRIALVVPGFEEGGGVPAVARFLAQVLRDSGRYRPEFVSLPMSSKDAASVRVTVPGTWWWGPRTSHDSSWGENFVRVGCVGSEFEFQRYRPRRVLTELLSGYDVIQVVAGTPVWALAASRAGRPVGLQVATRTAAERRSEWSRPSGPGEYWRSAMGHLSTRLEPRALRCADAVFVENSWMHEDVSQIIGPEQVRYAPPGVDTEVFRPATPGFASPPGPIVAVARFADPRKRIRLLFDAYHVLRSRKPDAPRLVIAGLSRPSDEDWEHAKRLDVRDCIDDLGAISGPELIALYRSASVFVSSSDEEGLGLAIIEAMACGVPVVSTDSGGPGESIVEGETGYLVPCGDARAIAEGLHGLLDNDPLRERMGEAGRRRAERQFSHAAAGRPFLEWYDEVLHV